MFRLQSQVEALETRVKEVRSETYKEGIIAMELEKTRVSNEYEEVIEVRCPPFWLFHILKRNGIRTVKFVVYHVVQHVSFPMLRSSKSVQQSFTG